MTTEQKNRLESLTEPQQKYVLDNLSTGVKELNANNLKSIEALKEVTDFENHAKDLQANLQECSNNDYNAMFDTLVAIAKEEY